MSLRAEGSRERVSVSRLLFLAAALGGCASAGDPEPATPPEPTTVTLTPAYYAAEQAERGRRVFGSVCSVCHSRNDFRGPIFELTWMAEPIGSLFQHISTTMPQDRPGSLSLTEYAAVVAYMLELNGRPAGDRELPADEASLATMRW